MTPEQQQARIEAAVDALLVYQAIGLMVPRLERAEAAARAFAQAARRVFDMADRMHSDEFADAVIALGLVLAAHPGWEPNP